MGGRRRGRQTYKVPRLPVIQKRDLFLFRIINKTKVVTTKDLIPLVFPSLTIARKRLRKLVIGKYIAGYAPILHDETRYVLDRRGYIALIEAYNMDMSVKSAPRSLKGPGEHHLGLVRFWSRLVYECHQPNDITLKNFNFEWELAPGHLHTVIRSRPDAIFTLAKNGQLHKFFVEFDCGTESPRYIATTKFSPFARTIAGGGRTSPAHMLVLVEEKRRLRALARVLGTLRAPILGRIFSRENEGDLLLKNTWFTLGNLNADLAKIPP